MQKKFFFNIGVLIANILYVKAICHQYLRIIRIIPVELKFCAILDLNITNITNTDLLGIYFRIRKHYFSHIFKKKLQNKKDGQYQIFCMGKVFPECLEIVLLYKYIYWTTE